MEPQISRDRNRHGPFEYILAALHVALIAHGNRMNRLGPAPLILIFILALAPAAAMASQQGALAMKNWVVMDQCAKAAQTAFPDFTAESNAKREAKERECLLQKNLPPREPLGPSH